MAIHEPLPDLFLVDLDQPLEGFRQFISAWVWRQGPAAVVVDPGPRSSLPVLVEALQTLGVNRLAAILLTHIHIDHAGGTGLLLERYPDTPVICHAKGIPHLADPTRLWAGSRQVLGPVADVYGEIAPVPEAAMSCPGERDIAGVPCRILETPGHAPHHLCFRLGDLLFTGEAAGVCYPVPEGRYQRPATPKPFRYEVSRASLQLLAEHADAGICLGHYGHRTDGRPLLATALAQLEHWLEVARRHRAEPSGAFEEAAFAELLASDPGLAAFPQLPPDVQRRERGFAANSLRGMRAYLEASDDIVHGAS